MEGIEGLKIPKNHIDFAKAVSKVADEFGMDKIRLNYSPKMVWVGKDPNDVLDRRIFREMKMMYSSTDGRGRPCKTLSLDCEAKFSLDIYEEDYPYGEYL